MLKTDVDYSYYANAFLGGMKPKLSAVEFYICASRAKTFLDCFLCCEEPLEAENAVKDCICCLAEEICRAESRKGIRSENTDGYSVTFYEDKGNSSLLKIVNTYLGNSGLMFAGVKG